MKNIITSKQKEELKKLLQQYPNIIAGYIFGSRFKGTNRQDSDLDIGLVCFNKDDISPLELNLEIAKIITKPEIDTILTDTNSDPLLLIQMIDGEVIFEKNLSDRTELESRILWIYEDNKNLIKIKNYYLQKSFNKHTVAN